jgi:hypothetical protein
MEQHEDMTAGMSDDPDLMIDLGPTTPVDDDKSGCPIIG